MLSPSGASSRSLSQACQVEVTDGEKEMWERQERERRGVFAEDEVRQREKKAGTRVMMR